MIGLDVRLSCVALWRNKGRSALACIGICVGIAAVIAVFAIGHGASELVERQVAMEGKNLVYVWPERRRKGEVSAGKGAGQNMTVRDVAAVESQLSHLVYAATPWVGTTRQLVHGNRNWNTSVSCDTDLYPEIHNSPVAEGRFFDREEMDEARRVCVIGSTVRDKLFEEGENPIDAVIRIGSLPFHVVGVLASKGANAHGSDQDDWVTMPYTTFTRYVQRSRLGAVGGMSVSMREQDDLEDGKREVEALLRQRHRLADWEDDDFEMSDQREQLQVQNAVAARMTTLLVAIALASLAVGGIGIMNVMLVSVSERIGEIGLRMALGATPMRVLMQFATESVLISSLGGAVGVLLGVVVSWLIGEWQSWPVLVEVPVAAGAFAFSALVGVFFGFYPAFRASLLNPIDCLRHE